MGLEFTRRQWLTLLIMALADFCNAICVSLQAPFFPLEAEKKGATATEYGLVFGIFELVVFLISPIYGQYINRVGAKRLFNAGIFTTGISAIFFGFLDRIPDHTTFIALAFTIRIIEALGNAAFLTASFSIIAKEFPRNIGVTFACLETFFGLGLIVGPTVGGALYAVDGYYLPFVVLGACLFGTALLTLCILPMHANEPSPLDKPHSMLKILKIPGMVVCSFAICATSASIGFIGATLEPHLRQFDLSPILLGVVFVINGGIYAILAPVWGYLVDKHVPPKIVCLFGSIFITLGFCLIGPAPFIPIDPDLSLTIVGLVLHGFGIGALLVSTFTDAMQSSLKKGFQDNIETYGLVSGLWTSTFALGAFFGPSISGILYDRIGFRASTVFVIFLHILLGIILTSFLCCDKTPQLYKEIGSQESLIKRSHESLLSTHIMETSYRSNRSASFYSSTDQQTIPIPKMNNLILCSTSLTSKPHHDSMVWQRMEDPTILSEQIDYGSIDAPHRNTIS